MGFVSSVVGLLLLVAILWSSGLFILLVLPYLCLVEPFLLPSAIGLSAFLVGVLILGLTRRFSTLVFVCFSIFFLVMAVTIQVGRSQTFDSDIMRNAKSSSKVAFVTGSTRGLGKDVAFKLCRNGWTVLVHGRKVKDMDRVSKEINDDAAVKKSQGRAIPLRVPGDLSSFAIVKDLANDALNLLKENRLSLSLIVFNAGIATKDPMTTNDDLDLIMQTNCVSSALIEKILTKEQKNVSRVVHVSSLSSTSTTTDLADATNVRKSMPFSVDDSAYGRSKLCQIGWAKRKHDKDTNSYVSVSVHPGGCGTDIGADAFSETTSIPGIPLFWWQQFVRPAMLKVYHQTWFPPSFCADQVLYAAFEENARNGDYFGRFKLIPDFFKHPFTEDEKYIEKMAENIEKEIDISNGQK